MKVSDYQKLALRTAPAKTTYREALSMGALGLTGEAGEVADEIKKLLFHRHPLDKNKLIKELGDVLWYANYLADALDTTLEEIMYINIEKLKARYPEGFSPEESLNRKPGDI